VHYGQLTKAIAEAYDKKRNKMMRGSTGSGSSIGAPSKYCMVYIPPEGQLHQSQPQQNWGNGP
jgi:hypothetical protein